MHFSQPSCDIQPVMLQQTMRQGRAAKLWPWPMIPWVFKIGQGYMFLFGDFGAPCSWTSQNIIRSFLGEVVLLKWDLIVMRHLWRWPFDMGRVFHHTYCDVLSTDEQVLSPVATKWNLTRFCTRCLCLPFVKCDVALMGHSVKHHCTVEFSGWWWSQLFLTLAARLQPFSHWCHQHQNLVLTVEFWCQLQNWTWPPITVVGINKWSKPFSHFHIGAVGIKVQQKKDVHIQFILMPYWWASNHWPRPLVDIIKNGDAITNVETPFVTCGSSLLWVFGQTAHNAGNANVTFDCHSIPKVTFTFPGLWAACSNSPESGSTGLWQNLWWKVFPFEPKCPCHRFTEPVLTEPLQHMCASFTHNLHVVFHGGQQIFRLALSHWVIWTVTIQVSLQSKSNALAKQPVWGIPGKCLAQEMWVGQYQVLILVVYSRWFWSKTSSYIKRRNHNIFGVFEQNVWKCGFWVSALCLSWKWGIFGLECVLLIFTMLDGKSGDLALVCKWQIFKC